MNRDLQRVIAVRWSTPEYPALAAQVRNWRETRPLDGLRVLDATPVYENTLPKYAALQAGGAEVTVSAGRGIPGDPHVLARLPEFGIAVAGEADVRRGFDVVMDCAGTHAAVPSRLGYVELTRSGAPRYADCRQPVLLVDAGDLKRIETSLGTGDGFVRAMAQLDHPVGPGRLIVVLGGGKVGFGVASASRAAGAAVTVVDPARVLVPPGAVLIDAGDRTAVTTALAQAWCVVSATGRRHGLAELAGPLTAGTALLANMGAEDEFGPEVPAARVLHAKVPVNFVLAEPTRLRYLDPTMALSNAGATELLDGRVQPGVQVPRPELERGILDVVRDTGAVADELAALLPGADGTGRS